MTATAFRALAPGAPMRLGHTLEMASPSKSTKPHTVTCEPERSQKASGSKSLLVKNVLLCLTCTIAREACC